MDAALCPRRTSPGIRFDFKNNLLAPSTAANHGFLQGAEMNEEKRAELYASPVVGLSARIVDAHASALAFASEN
jgi:hypothetical protein